MRAFRKLMGWETADLGDFLRLRGRASEFVHKMESDDAPISGPVQTAIEERAAFIGFTLNSQGHWQPMSTRGEGK